MGASNAAFISDHAQHLQAWRAGSASGVVNEGGLFVWGSPALQSMMNGQTARVRW
jgi:hypothetical protein